jgi:predicted 3-demethylubiquinone-9 3-methyltransferase (glyoxalase superfamily)
MQKITTCFWFDNNLEEALNFYASVFKDAKVKVTRIPGGLNGDTLVGEITLFGQQFRALQGGPMFKFNEAISFYVNCEDQEEVDYYWSKLTADGGQESACGWLKDKYGISWQITPKQIFALLEDKDTKKVGRAMEVMMKMRKIEWQKMKDAFDGK